MKFNDEFLKIDNCYNSEKPQIKDNSDEIIDYIDVKNKENQYIFVSNFQSLKVYESELETKKKIITTFISFLLVIQLILNSYIAFISLKECKKRVKNLMNNFEISKTYKEETDLQYTYICASYLCILSKLICLL